VATRNFTRCSLWFLLSFHVIVVIIIVMVVFVSDKIIFYQRINKIRVLLVICRYLQRLCSPAPSISFTKREGSLPLGRHRIRREGSELFIENVQPEDEGDYLCKASNRVGDAEEIIQIAVEGQLTSLTSSCLSKLWSYNLYFLISRRFGNCCCLLRESVWR